MTDAMPELSLTLHRGIADIPAADWDACAGGDNPFVCHAFLAALEESGSATARTGWLPQHAALRDGCGRLLACAPCYAKSHSQGEYVFDYGWADAFERAGGELLPEAAGLRALQPRARPAAAGARRLGLPAAALAHGLAQACGQLGLSSVHVTFCEEAEWEALGEAGWLQRLGTQFHWQQRGLRRASTTSSAPCPRASARRSGASGATRAASGFALRTLRGPRSRRAHWKAFHRFYRSTTDKKWGRSAYLTPRFWPLHGRGAGRRAWC